MRLSVGRLLCCLAIVVLFAGPAEAGCQVEKRVTVPVHLVDGAAVVDVVINDFSYLREHRDKFRALLVTHGHEDHIGGIPYLLREFDVPVVGTPMTLALIRAKMRDQKFGDRNFVSVNPGDVVRYGAQRLQRVRQARGLADEARAQRGGRDLAERGRGREERRGVRGVQPMLF